MQLTASSPVISNGQIGTSNGKHRARIANYLSDIHTDEEPFKLDTSFTRLYKGQRPNFGYGGLGEFVFFRTYSRLKDNGTKETFLDVMQRVVEGCYEIQRRHCRKIHVPWDYDKALVSAHEMFEHMWKFKFLPPGRGLWCMGTNFMWERGSAALNNCGFCSTVDILVDPAEPFCFLMDMSMVGVGVGFDTRGRDLVKVVKPGSIRPRYVIDDSREGWVDSVRMLIQSYTNRPELGRIRYDYSQIRLAGAPIKGFGGYASGPGVLRDLHERLIEFFEHRIGKMLTSRCITDIMNIIGAAVVAGNVRRTAEIGFGDPDDFAYTSMKNPVAGLSPAEANAFWAASTVIFKSRKTQDEEGYDAKALWSTTGEFTTTIANIIQQAKAVSNLKNDASWFDKNIDTFKAAEGVVIDSERLAGAVETWNYLNQHRWASNNSVFATIGMDYTSPAGSTAINGEPGYCWLENIQNYGRMIDGYKPGIDARAMGTNPCGEQSLESYELCCLAETFPANHANAAEFMRTLKFSYLYTKTVTLLPTHNVRTNQVMLRNRRIGLSQSGIVQAIEKFGRRTMLKEFCDGGYAVVRKWDKIYSEWLCIPQSIKVTSVKPSGTISLVVGATPGIHYPEARCYWRRVRVAADSMMVGLLQEAGYHIEPALSDPKRTVVVTFAIDESHLRSVKEVTMWEQAQNVADYQKYWADNQPSCTVKFKREEAAQLPQLLQCFEDRLKCMAFMPMDDHNFAQAPYEACTKDEVSAYNAKLKPIDFSRWVGEDADSNGTKFCDGASCGI